MNFDGRTLNIAVLWEDLGLDVPQGISGDAAFWPLTHCPNPAHDTTKRHFQVNARKPFVHCFANCGISGHYEHAVSVVLGLYASQGATDEMVAITKAKREPNESPALIEARAKVARAHKEARRFIIQRTRVSLAGDVTQSLGSTGHRKTLGHDSAVARDEAKLEGGAFQFLPTEVRNYLDKRGIEASSRGKWRLGWCEEEERLIVPAFDDRSVFRFLIKRAVGNQMPKYLYTDGAIKTSLLFGADMLDLDAVKSKGLVLVEGSLDVIRLHQLGVTNAVAILGTGLSERQVRIIDRLSPRRLYLMYDRDGAGANNVLDTKGKISRIPLSVCRYPNDKADPAEMTADEAHRSIERAIPMHEFLNRLTTTRSAKRKVLHG